MPCIAPLTGYQSAVVNPSGKRSIVFRLDQAHSPRKIMVPCGRCVECRRRDCLRWALRLTHENKSHRASSFVSLTYDKDHLPEGGTLVHRDFQLFMKRLRKLASARVSSPLKYYMCGEYGPVNLRPHYHAIIFGYDFGDRKVFKRGSDPVFTSRELDAVWQNGFATVGDVSFKSCAYVAGYVLKKAKGDNSSEVYSRVDANGRVYSVCPEYGLGSNGLGLGWLEKFGKEAFLHDNAIVDGRPVALPRYYDEKYRLTDPEHFEYVRRRRVERARRSRADNTTRRLRVKELIALAALKRKERKL